MERTGSSVDGEVISDSRDHMLTELLLLHLPHQSIHLIAPELIVSVLSMFIWPQFFFFTKLCNRGCARPSLISLWYYFLNFGFDLFFDISDEYALHLVLFLFQHAEVPPHISHKIVKRPWKIHLFNIWFISEDRISSSCIYIILKGHFHYSLKSKWTETSYFVQFCVFQVYAFKKRTLKEIRIHK